MARVKYLLLLPITYNDGSEVPEDVREAILERIFVLAGGYSIAGPVQGAYRMKGGQKQVDHLTQIWIVIDEADEDELKQMVAEFCAQLNQEALYLERTEGAVEFIAPAEPRGRREP